jgi:hypothetical protein
MLLAAPVRAEPLRMAQALPSMLPAHEIATIVRSAGFVPTSPAIRRGEIYVLRASAPDGREMRLTVEARRGRILAARPVPDEIALPGERLGPYERMVPPGYIDADEPDEDVVRSGPPVVYEGGRPLIYERRPAEPIPSGPGGTQLGARGSSQDIAAPPPIMRDDGPLPAPPERFPQRASPPPTAKPAARPQPAKPAADKPAPVKRAAAGPPPLPKPKPPAASAEEPSKQSWESQAAESQAAPPAADKPPAAPAPAKSDPRALPH